MNGFIWISALGKRGEICEGDGSRAALPLCAPPCGPLRSKNNGLTSNWECAMIWYLVSHIETLQNTISSRTFLYNVSHTIDSYKELWHDRLCSAYCHVSPSIDSYEALYSIISHTIRTHRSSHNETRNIRHFTHPQSDVSTLFSSVPWKGGAGGKPGLQDSDGFPPAYSLTLSKSVLL